MTKRELRNGQKKVGGRCHNLKTTLNCLEQIQSLSKLKTIDLSLVVCCRLKGWCVRRGHSGKSQDPTGFKHGRINNAKLNLKLIIHKTEQPNQTKKCRKGGIMQALYVTPAWACCSKIVQFFHTECYCTKEWGTILPGFYWYHQK